MLVKILNNRDALSKSDPVSVFTLFDDFDSPTLSSEWTFSNGGYSNNKYSISNSVITFDTGSNDYTISLTGNRLFYPGMVETNFRMVPGQYATDLDFTLEVLGDSFVFIGVEENVNETPHRMQITGQSTVYGEKFTSSSFKTHTII